MIFFKTKYLSVLLIPQVIDNNITVHEAAEITGYYAQYLRWLLRAGKMEAIKLGQNRLVNPASQQVFSYNAIISNDMRFGSRVSWQPQF